MTTTRRHADIGNMKFYFRFPPRPPVPDCSKTAAKRAIVTSGQSYMRAIYAAQMNQAKRRWL